MNESKCGSKIMRMFQKYGKIEKTDRKTLMNLVYDFILERYENNFEMTNVKQVCVELIDIFPIFQVQPSKINGIVGFSTYLRIYKFSLFSFFLSFRICSIIQLSVRNFYITSSNIVGQSWMRKMIRCQQH